MTIAGELGIESEGLTRNELVVMDAFDLADRIDDIAVFARVAPKQKSQGRSYRPRAMWCP